MLDPDSPLYRLSSSLEPKQAIFLDGIRHSAEFFDYAYNRLRSSLTEIAESAQNGTTSSMLYTPAFIDAWAVIDAIDRLRGLVIKMPGVQNDNQRTTKDRFLELTEELRKVRNVSDHLSQRADYVVSCKSTALGILSWFTFSDSTLLKGTSFSIIPGTILNSKSNFINPAGQPFNPPTDLIYLEAGAYQLSLSTAVRHAIAFIESLERSLATAIGKADNVNAPTYRDILLAADFEF